jgi:hypothetical protein
MTAQEYSDLLTNFDPTSENQRKVFEKITYRYPYFQSAYAHYLKALKAQEQYNYDLILRKTAVLSPERETLHQWLEKDLEKEIAQPLEVIQNNEADKAILKTEASAEAEIIKPVKEKNIALVQATEQLPSEKNQIEEIKEKPLKKVKSKKKETPIAMTYADWVIYSSKDKIAPKEKKSSLDEKISLIDTFLENRPKIPPVKQDQPKVDLSANNEFNKEELMTETLAKVYLQQKKFKKALYAYQILSLKYPEKNSFFADQIKKIKQLQQKTKS